MVDEVSQRDGRPGLAVVSNVATPYRIHLHRRLVAEIPELRFHSYYTHAQAEFNYQLTGVEQTHPVWLAGGREDVSGAGRPASWPRELRRARRIIDDIRRHDIRALVINGYNDMTRLRLMQWCRGAGVPVFLRGDSNIKGDRPGGAVRSMVKRRLLRRVIRMCTGVMPMGTFGQQYFEKYGADPARCFWVPYEPDYDALSSVEPDALEAFRRAHTLAGDRRHLLYCGRLAAVKRVDLLIDAFVHNATRRPGWDLLVAGDGPLRGELERRLPEGLADRVRWLGFLEFDQLRLAYHAADVLVLPSDYEPWALVVNEAMAAGLPVVSSDVVGAARELVEDGVSGRVFRSGDGEDLARALQDITDDAAFERYHAAVGPALEAWRRKADPVAGIRAALRSVNLVSEQAATMPGSRRRVSKETEGR